MRTTYDVMVTDNGKGALECVRAHDGSFTLSLYHEEAHGWTKVSLDGLTADRLVTIGKDLIEIAKKKAAAS